MNISNVNNDSNESNPVGRFMAAVGAVIQNPEGKILLIKRSQKLDWHPGEWEIMYGRLAQHEDPQMGLKREVQEELGIKIITSQPLRVWHIYRGQLETAYNELIGITFLATTDQVEVRISKEHEEYRWVSPKEALDLIQINGIREDIYSFLNLIG